jgi:bifunctional NMN adenylyltransferase/nudix hydrolase
MDTKKLYDKTVGGIIGRFQVPQLHAAHKELIETVLSKHKRVILCLGISHMPCIGNTPLNFEIRKQMILKDFPDITVIPLPDYPEDAAWSRNVDYTLFNLLSSTKIILYGGRDSFIPKYSGIFKTCELKLNSSNELSGKQSRTNIPIRDMVAFREGICWAVNQQLPIIYPVLYAIILNEENKILMIKPYINTKYNIPSFFTVEEQFITLSYEQMLNDNIQCTFDLEISATIYIGSTRINQYKYGNEEVSNMSLLFICKKIFGNIQIRTPQIEKCEWFTLDEIMKLDVGDIFNAISLIKDYFVKNNL